VTDEWAKKRDTIRGYNRLSSVYDAQFKDEQVEKLNLTLRFVEMNKGDKILDAGCGTGLIAEVISDRYVIIGVDASQGLLMKAKERFRRRKDSHLVLADVDHLPFKDAIFDHAFAVTLIQNMPNPTKTLGEIKRTCKARSSLVVTGLKKNFNLRSFLSTLEEAGMNVVLVCDLSHVKDYVAVCGFLR
jgi:ubiquinone/menaquinone biosynthesis C-methylase UbiE